MLKVFKAAVFFMLALIPVFLFSSCVNRDNNDPVPSATSDPFKPEVLLYEYTGTVDVSGVTYSLNLKLYDKTLNPNNPDNLPEKKYILPFLLESVNGSIKDTAEGEYSISQNILTLNEKDGAFMAMSMNYSKAAPFVVTSAEIGGIQPENNLTFTLSYDFENP